MHKRIVNPVSALVFLTLLTVGAVIPATYAWYSVSTSISVQSSSVLVTTASPDYGEFTLQRLYILQPDYGEVDLNTPSNAVKDVELFPVSTVDGSDYQFKIPGATEDEDKIISYDKGKYRFLAHVSYAQFNHNAIFNFSFNVGIPKCGNVEHPDWSRVHLQMWKSFNFETKEGSSPYGTTDGYILTRDSDPSPKGMDNGGNEIPITGLTRHPLDHPFSIAPKDYKVSVSGNIYFEVTLFLEGTKMELDERMTNEISLSMFVYPSPRPNY